MTVIAQNPYRVFPLYPDKGLPSIFFEVLGLFRWTFPGGVSGFCFSGRSLGPRGRFWRCFWGVLRGRAWPGSGRSLHDLNSRYLYVGSHTVVLETHGVDDCGDDQGDDYRRGQDDDDEHDFVSKDKSGWLKTEEKIIVLTILSPKNIIWYFIHI